MDTKKQNKAKELIILDPESAEFMKSKTEAQRLEYMPAFIALSCSFLLLLFSILEYYLPVFSFWGNSLSWQNLAIRYLFHFGLIPLLVFSLTLLIYRPTKDLILQQKDSISSILAAVFLAFFSALAYYLLLELLTRLSFIRESEIYLPEIITDFAPFLRGSFANIFTVLLLSVLLPVATMVPFLLAFFYSPLCSNDKAFVPGLLICLFAGFFALDSKGFFTYLLLYFLLTRIYKSGSGLITATVSALTFFATITYASRLYSFLTKYFTIWQSRSDLQSALLIFALLLIVLILNLPGIFYFNIKQAEKGRRLLALSLQPHISKHLEKTKTRAVAGYVAIAFSLVLLAAISFFRELS